jgi:hypothetical protein
MLDHSSYIPGARYGQCWYVMKMVYTTHHFGLRFLCSCYHQVKVLQRCLYCYQPHIVVNIWQWCRWELILLIKLRFSSPGKGNLSRFSLSCLDPFVLLLPKLWKLFGFAIFPFRPHIKVFLRYPLTYIHIQVIFLRLIYS